MQCAINLASHRRKRDLMCGDKGRMIARLRGRYLLKLGRGREHRNTVLSNELGKRGKPLSPPRSVMSAVAL